MEILLTAPLNVAKYAATHPSEFPGITGIYSDPEGTKLGSGGGTVNVLWEHYRGSNDFKFWMSDGRKIIPDTQPPKSFLSWLSKEKRIIIHSDGQSRRLPAYSTVGKSFIPFPVFKWGRGQRIDQTLFDIQKPLLEKILYMAPVGLNTLVVSGDVLVWVDRLREKIPQADVVCIGIWSQPEVAAKHGVFVCPRNNPFSLEYMVQKPSIERLQSLTDQFLYLLDAGIWLLSDKAVEFLFMATGWNAEMQDFKDSIPRHHDLY